jgi:hypothetical protein
MQQMISGLKNNWGNFSDGSKWVFNYTSSSKGLTQFGGKKIRFELPTETELGLRRIDIADVTNPNNPIHSSQSLRFRDSAQTQTFSRTSHPFRGLGRKHNQI